MMHFKTMFFGLLGLFLSLTSFANSGGSNFESSNQIPDCSLVSNQINNMIYLGEYNDSKYYCSNTSNFTWQEAKSAAEANGGHLLIINNAAENEYIRSNIMADYVWLGLTDEDSEGNFITVQGQNPSYVNWETGEPNNNNGTEHYVRLLRSNGKWTDRNASFEAEYVLEIPCPDPDNPPNPTPPTGEVCTTRTASNVVNCNNDITYGGWLKLDGENFHYTISNGQLVEYDDGTAIYTARWTNNDQSNIVFDIDITLTGKTETPPGTPKPHECLNPNIDEFYYYQNFSGSLTGKQSVDGAKIIISSYGAAPQLGIGANATGTENAFGMSAWFSGYIIQQPNSGGDISLDAQSGGHIGDINIKLSGGPDDCEDCVDSDNDGTCNVDDCEPNNPDIPTSPGITCDDNNSNTINDVILADGCTCSGIAVPNISINDITVNEEDGTATLEICLDQTTTVDVSVDYASNNASAIDGSDYNANSGQALIVAGQTCTEVTFNIIDDENPEDTESFVVDLTNPTNGNISDPQGTVTILDSDVTIPNISINDITVNEEDGTATLEICLDQTTTVDVSVDYTSNNASAIDGSDYNANSGQALIVAGQTCTEVTFNIINDENPEDTENFLVDLTNPTNSEISDPQGTVTILDSDVIVPNISINEVTVNEEDGTATLEICLDQTTTVPVTVTYTTANAAANAGTDYVAKTAQATIPAGETCVEVSFEIIDDENPEDTEPFFVNLSAPVNGNISNPSGLVTILDSDVTVPNISINDVTVNEEDGTATLEICLDQTTTVPVTVDYATADATATDGSDYNNASATVTIPAGETCVEVTFDIIEDGTPEDEENFVVNLTNPTNGQISDPQGTVTILDSDVIIPNISINDVTVNEEDGTATLQICLDQTTTVPVRVTYTTSDAAAIAGSDYVAKTAQATIPAGETCVEVSFEIIDDENPEDTEPFFVNLSAPVNGNISNPSGLVTILDSDVTVPNISINDVTVNEEDGTATLEICLDQTTTVPVTVDYATADATATDGSDYNNASATVTIPAGETCVEVTFDIIEDGTPEDEENFVVNLTNPMNGEISDPQGTVTILDSDVIIPNISINDVTVNEEDGTATLQICLDQTTTVPVRVTYTTSDAAAIAGSDYVAKTAQATIPAGETCVEVSFEIIDDENPEDTEPFFVNLSAPVNGNISNPSGLVTILDTDVIVPNISINDVTVNEEDGTATLEICLDQTTTVPVTVDYATADATAIDGSDYNNASATVTIPAGETCVEVTFDIIEDGTPEDEENFVVNLTNPTNGEINDPQGTVTILDSDVIIPNISINDVTVNEEDGTATLEICLDQTTTVPITVTYTTADAAANAGTDYVAKTAQATIPAGETCVEVSFEIIDDENPEDTEPFFVNLSAPVNGNISNPSGLVTILDTDVIVPNISINDVTVNEENGTATLEICLDQTTTVPVTVDYATADATAIDGSDYNNASATVTIPAGETCVEVTFDIIEDGTPEDEENFVVNLTNPTNGEISDPQGTVTILDSDVITPNISINDVTVNEEDGTATLEICLDQTTTVPVTVTYTTADAAANAGTDYVAKTAQATIPAGETCVEVSFEIIDDENPEDTEPFFVNLSAPVNGNISNPSGLVTILDSDVTVPNISINDVTVNEEDGTATLEICLDQTTTVPVTVDYVTADATATDGSDYNNASATVTIPAGETCVEVTFDIIEDGTPEDEENFVINLTNPTNGEISDPQGTVTILDSDVIIPNISINDVTVNEEDGTATLEICLDQTTTVPVTVDYVTADATATDGSDYNNASATVTIPAGETCVEVTFDIIEDGTPEDEENFVINLTNPTNGEISDPQGTVTILDSDVIIPNISINDVTVNEEDGTATLEICLDQTTTVPVTVTYTTADAAANAGTDYVAKTAQATIPAGETCVEVSFEIIDDENPEDTEPFFVNLSAPVNGNISNPSGLVTILDSDVTVPNISINDVTVNEEDGTATLEICLDQTTTVPVTVDYATADATAVDGSDYNNASTTVTIPAGLSCVQVTFDIIDDEDPEDTEYYVVNLTNPTNGEISDAQGTVTILDTDEEPPVVPNITINDITVNEEDGIATLQICLDQTTTVPVTVNYATSDAAAIEGSDYEAKSAQVTIPAGETCVDVTFNIIDDENPESTEPFFVNLSVPVNANIGNPSGLVTILDTDEAPPVVPNISINDITVNEEDGIATLQICLDQTTTVPVTVNYATSDAAAIAGADYEAKSAQVTIPAGETCVDVTFNIIDDENPESTEPFFVNLSVPVNANIGNPSGLVTILDTDEAPPVVPNISINDITVNEEDGIATLQICLDQTTTVPVTVNYATSDAAAIAGADYEAKSAQATIPAGETCVDVTFNIIDDENPESTEPFFVNLSAPVNANIGNPSGLVTILDTDEAPPVVPNISINDITVNEEDGIATLQICLDQTTTVPVTVNYATSDAAAIAGADYEAKSAQATIPAGEACVDVTFNIIDDENPESTEPFFVNLSAPVNANIGNPSGLVTILDTDEAPPVVPNITINDITVNEEDGIATLQICLDQATTVPVTVNYATSDGSAEEGLDFNSSNGTATIPVGQTCVDVTFDIVDDNDPEDTESFVVNLTNPTNGNVSDPQGTITILDGDIPCPDADGDGLCDNDDCAPNDANLPTSPGTACDDNNANTINDVIQSDGCTCAGVAPPCDLTVELGGDMTICSGDNAAITAIVDGAAVCSPPDCNSTTLVTYNGSCDDPTECLFPSGIASCLSDVSGICPTEGPVNSSCNNNIICIASMFNSWDFTMTADSPFEFKEIEADFWYPTDGSNAGGTANSSSCPTSYDATIQFFVDDVLIATKIVNVDENQILTKVVGPDSPILVATGSTLRVEIGGTPDDEDCDLFELAGLRVNGCCSPQTPLETNTYSWSGPGVNNASAATVVVSEAGDYCVTVTDCSGCTSTDCMTVAQPAANLNAEINVLNMPSSVNASNGVLQVAASGGTGPYSYAWSNGQANSAISGLSGGDYGVTITDNNGCTSSSNITLNSRAVIGDRIWNDENQNGIQDAGEEGLSGLTVTINGLQSGGNVYTNSTVSGADGIYAFDNLDPGEYEIGFTAPQDFVGTLASGGNDTTKDSDADPVSGNTGSISVDFNDVIDDIDAGFYRDCSDLETDFTISEPICINSMAIFDAFPVGAGASYNWYFFNGPSTSSTYIGSQAGQSVGMSFTSAGQKLVRLSVEFDGCEFNVDHVITVLDNNDPACSSCSNITDGGQIGNDQSGCAPFNPGDLTNITAPSGGNGTIEYRWAASISGTAPQGFDDPNWTVINTADQIVYKPGTINQTTYYVRFSRRSGCEEWTGMSNVVEVEVLGDDITAEFEVLNDPICSGSVLDLAAFDVGTNAAYDWYFFNGPSTSSTFRGSRSGQEVNFTFTSGGEKLVRLSVTNSYGCSAIIDQIVTVLEESDPACANNLIQNNLELRLALNQDDEVMLDWKATNEPGGAVYEIEHSLDGINFEVIGTNNSGTKSGNAMSYDYVDDMVSFGMNYYRVKQILVDGQFQYSSIKDVTIKFTDGNKGIVFPNPAMDLTTLMFSSPLEKQTEFEVVNAQGAIVKRFTMASGMDRIDLNVSRWQAGYYFIYTTESGYRQLVNKLLKAN